MTLYNHFRSKDELILVVLRRRDEQFRNWLMEEMEKASKQPDKRLLAMFNAVESWFAGQAFKGLGFNGCAFVNAAAEFSNQDHPAHRVAAEHKRSIVEYLKCLCAEAGAVEPDTLAEQLALLKEGAIATAHVRGLPKEAVTLVKTMAAKLISEATNKIEA